MKVKLTFNTNGELYSELILKQLETIQYYWLLIFIDRFTIVDRTILYRCIIYIYIYIYITLLNLIHIYQYIDILK